ncbi:hypothetical protein KR215_001473 [Drosophila sulfurigaster]|uniref:uncharacterized protein LOC132791578 n=1 Tax=Drosophila nasuta TaxID=42062 RepID=UPI00295F1DFF|nr:uncharacterized protein LOC132791578 [Drosophila nasuta]XP_062134318.1 uncharacterized protein LOC133844384 [Drosophila sulfurigaster albostrigata]KAH8399059.1 hypothetical protein KR215_001473 [Drosophila sulfurigaster]
MCDYVREYSFCFDDTFNDDDISSSQWDCGFENMWEQIGEELRQERENNMFMQCFQEKLILHNNYCMDSQ